MGRYYIDHIDEPEEGDSYSSMSLSYAGNATGRGEHLACIVLYGEKATMTDRAITILQALNKEEGNEQH